MEIAYRPAVTDPETPSILAGAKALGEEGLQFARLSRRYQFCGLDETEAKGLAARFLYNKVVERIREPHEAVTTLRPSGKPDPVGTVSLQALTMINSRALSRERSWYAPLSQMKVIQAHEQERGRPYTDAEIEILVQSWSDHCYHTTWKSLGLLKKLMAATREINHPLVVSSFTDNAGGMDFADGWVVTIKGETHNFPSSIAPFGGIATKHGGVIRDTLGFGKGAYPIGGTTVMGTMDPRLPEKRGAGGRAPSGIDRVGVDPRHGLLHEPDGHSHDAPHLPDPSGLCQVLCPGPLAGPAAEEVRAQGPAPGRATLPCCLAAPPAATASTAPPPAPPP